MNTTPPPIPTYEARPTRCPSTAHALSTLPRRIPKIPGTGAKLGGVCEGLGLRYQIDPTLIRIGFVCAGFAGFGIVLYLLCMFFMPTWGNDRSPAQLLFSSSTGTDADKDGKALGGLLFAILLLLFIAPTFIDLFVFGGGFLIGGSITATIITTLIAVLLYLNHPAVPAPMAALYPDHIATMAPANRYTTTAASTQHTPAAQQEDNQPMSTPSPDEQATEVIPTTPEDHDNPSNAEEAATVFLNNDTAENTSTTQEMPGYAPITATPTPQTTGTARILHVIGWFAFVFIAGITAITAYVAHLAISNYTTNNPNDVALTAATILIPALLGIGGLLVGATVTLLCYAKPWKALIAFALAIATAVSLVFYSATIDRNTFTSPEGSHATYNIAAEDALDDTYSLENGLLELDLTDVGTLTQNRTVTVDVDLGEISILVPDTIPLVANCTADLGSTDCAVDNTNQDTTAPTLTINAHINVGTITINRTFADTDEEDTTPTATSTPTTDAGEKTVTTTVTVTAPANA